MIKARIELKGDLKKYVDRISRVVADEIYERSQKNIDEMDIIASGYLKKSGFVGKLDDGVWVVKYYMPYSRWVEFGTEPHMPPVEPLIEWAMVKFNMDEKEARKVAWAVATEISKKGTKPRPFLRNAIDSVRSDIKMRRLKINVGW